MGFYSIMALGIETEYKLMVQRYSAIRKAEITGPEEGMADLKEILEDAKTIAVVGCSSNPAKPSHRIAEYMKEAGYTIIPVNPKYDEVHCERCYPDLASIPPDVRIDIVNIFRRPQYTADMVRQVLERVKATGEKPVIWTQLGVSSQEAERLATEAGLTYVSNRCIMVEYGRYFPVPG